MAKLERYNVGGEAPTPVAEEYQVPFDLPSKVFNVVVKLGR